MSLIDVITSEAFLEKLALLLAAAVLTGVLVPFVESYMDRASFEKRVLASPSQVEDHNGDLSPN